MGLTNAAANVMSIIAPLLVGFIVKDETDPGEWRMVFFISAGVYFFGNLMFVLFSSTDIQPWNDPDQRDRRKLFIHFAIHSMANFHWKPYTKDWLYTDQKISGFVDLQSADFLVAVFFSQAKHENCSFNQNFISCQCEWWFCILQQFLS